MSDSEARLSAETYAALVRAFDFNERNRIDCYPEAVLSRVRDPQNCVLALENCLIGVTHCGRIVDLEFKFPRRLHTDADRVLAAHVVPFVDHDGSSKKSRVLGVI